MQYMHKMSEASDDDLDGFTAFAKDTIGSCINRDNVILRVTASVYADISGLISMLPEGKDQPLKACYESSLPAHMGIQVPAAVSFSVLAYDMSAADLIMSGSMSVAANIIGLAHLWNVIRVQGGAYGAGMRARQQGDMLCYTFRDPTPARSLEVYGGMADHLSAYCASGEKPAKYIISTVAETEPLRSPFEMGKFSDSAWFPGRTAQDEADIRRSILATTPEKLQRWCGAVAKLAQEAPVCVIAHDEALKACEGLEIENA